MEIDMGIPSTIDITSPSSALLASNKRFLESLSKVTIGSDAMAQKVFHSGVHFTSCYRDPISPCIPAEIPQEVQLSNGFALCRKLPKGTTKEILYKIESHFKEIRKTLSLLTKLRSANPPIQISKEDKHDLYYCLAQCYASKGCHEAAIRILDKILFYITEPEEGVERKRCWAYVIALRALLVSDVKALRIDRALFITSPDVRVKFWVDFGFEFQIIQNERYAAICYEKALEENKNCSTPQKNIYPVVQKTIDCFLLKFYFNLAKNRERECAGMRNLVKNLIILKNIDLSEASIV
jgi:tetratricopeptide (TPR) repeat protein